MIQSRIPDSIAAKLNARDVVIAGAAQICLEIAKKMRKLHSQAKIFAVLPENGIEEALDGYVALLKALGVSVHRGAAMNAPKDSNDSISSVAKRLAFLHGVECHVIGGIELRYCMDDDIFLSKLALAQADQITCFTTATMDTETSVEFAQNGSKLIMVTAANSDVSGCSKLQELVPMDDLKVPFVSVSDQVAFTTSRELIREHGLMVGPCSGAVFHAAREHKKLHPTESVAAMLPDMAYLNSGTLLNDTWMMESFSSILSTKVTANSSYYVVADMDLAPVTAITRESPIALALETMLEREYDFLPVLDEKRKMVGCLRLKQVQEMLDGKSVSLQDRVDKCMNTWSSPKNSAEYIPITLETPVNNLHKFFDTHSVAFVTDSAMKWVVAVCTKMDLNKFLSTASR